MAKTPFERASDRIKFKNQVAAGRLSDSRGYWYGDESTINYKKKNRVGENKKTQKKVNKKNKSLFDIIDLEG